MKITIADFRTNFPAFADPAVYPDGPVQFFLDFGYTLLSASRWGELLSFGIQYFVAHNLFLENLAQMDARDGNAPGSTAGAVSSQSGGGLSISWDSGSAAAQNAGHWNMSTYGRQYIRYARMIGAGGLQLGIGAAAPLSGPAWVGPPPWPGWFGS